LNFAKQDLQIVGEASRSSGLSRRSAATAAVPDHVPIQVKRYDLNWLESARLWVALIGNLSTKKTPIMQRAANSVTSDAVG
jgi:hypothetical protein